MQLAKCFNNTGKAQKPTDYMMVEMQTKALHDGWEVIPLSFSSEDLGAQRVDVTRRHTKALHDG